MIDSSDKAFDRGITIAFLAVLCLIAFWTLLHGLWQGSLFDGNRTTLIDLKIQPAWNSPPEPIYADFQKVFHDLSPKQTEGSRIAIGLKWDWMLLDFVLHLVAVSVIFAILSLIKLSGRHNFCVYLIRSLAVSLTISAAVCFVVWLIVGGWGPPSPSLFAVLGLTFGIWGAFYNWYQPL